MDEHPGIRFDDGALGRRPALVGSGLDVWEVIETVQNDGSVAEAAAYLGIEERLVRTAIGYYASNREEIDAFIARVQDIAEHEEAKWLRARDAIA